MMWNNGYDMGWGMWVVMGLGTIAFWVVVVLVVRALMPGRYRNADMVAADVRRDPLTLLKEGLARGDVTLQEYEQRRRLITDGR
ncbi:MAG: SHOCT domain-containing protein [Actinomycetota bacterium]|nr:SHOCT domain-containing protein [Actinomycetota bacterium]